MTIIVSLISKEHTQRDCVTLCVTLEKTILFHWQSSSKRTWHADQSQESAPSENVVRLRVVLENVKPMMKSAVKELRRAGLLQDIFGSDMNLQSTTCSPHSPNLHTNHYRAKSQYCATMYNWSWESLTTQSFAERYSRWRLSQCLLFSIFAVWRPSCTT